MKNYHLKDKKITILKNTNKRDEYGEIINELTPVYENIWAYYRQASGNEMYLALQTNTRIEAIFEIEWIKSLESNMVIRYMGQDYSISRIDDYEGGKNSLRMYAYKYEG